MATKEAINHIKESLETLYGERLARLVLFGSQVRGDADEHSDIDVLVVLRCAFERREERKRTLDLMMAIILDYEELLSLHFMDEERFLHGQDPLSLNVRREGVRL